MTRSNSVPAPATALLLTVLLGVGCGNDKSADGNAAGASSAGSGALAAGGGSGSSGSSGSSAGNGPAATGGRSNGTTGSGGGSVASAGSAAQGYLPGDVWQEWEGGPAYYGRWRNGPSTDPSFFPIAVWLQAPDSAGTAARYREIGVNMHVGLWEGPTEAQLTAAAALPTVVIATQNATGLASPNAGLIKAWLQGDEPDNAQDNTEDPMPPETVIANYQSMVAADATRPVYLNFGQGVAADTWYGRGNRTNHPEDYPVYAQGGDILSFDIYPMNVFTVAESEQDWKKAFHNAVAQNIWYVASGVDRLRAWAGQKKPVWVWIETTNFNGQAGFALTPDLVAAEVWMALIHGARGIGYFCHVFSPSFIEAGLLADAAMTARISTINTQIRSLAPILNTQSVANGVATTSSNAAVPVDTMLKRFGGSTYVFAVGMRPAATTATFTLRGVSGKSNVEVVGEGRSLEATDGVLRDAFSAHAVHIYRVAHR
ncbi:MAG TPA: hypothetical protein VKP30_26130 [Polyangiaceae bacterium]|nr:hypothetical protein [Polyangiaceae bacterium]